VKATHEVGKPTEALPLMNGPRHFLFLGTRDLMARTEGPGRGRPTTTRGHRPHRSTRDRGHSADNKHAPGAILVLRHQERAT
jgi:hypothetical protein